MLTYIDTMIGFSIIMLLLSLLVTILVQGAISVVNLRGASLRWGVAEVLRRAAPKLDEADAKEIAEEVLRHPSISPPTMVLGRRLATAIRSNELLRILEEMAERNPESFEIGTRKGILEKVTSGFGRVYEAIPDEEIARMFPEEERAKAKQVLALAGKKAREQADSLKAWFDTVMDRTSEQFVARTRLVTLFFAVALALSLRIDSLAILRQISTNPDLRARLVQSADATLKLASDVTTKAEHDRQLVTEALEAAKLGLPSVQLPDVSDDLVTRGQARAWIAAGVKDPQDRASFQEAFDLHYDQIIQERTQGLIESAGKVKEQLTQTELVVVGAYDATWAWGSHFIGVLMTALFLSLGAPFWFNLLRELGNLRPLLAGKVEKSEGKG